MTEVERSAPDVGLNDRRSPPPTPPSPAYAVSETKATRKREREVSLEPAATSSPAASGDARVAVPAKNKRRLDATEEEEDGKSSRSSRSTSRTPPPVSGSPPGEMKIKVRQISQGVEDLSWRNGQSSQNGSDDAEALKTPGGNGVELQDDPMLNAGESSSPQIPSISGQTLSRRDSDSDNGDKENTLKRKFVDRGTSQGPSENGDSQKAPGSEPLKRARDDGNIDSNSRETKRPTPPPDESSPNKNEPLKRQRDDADKDDNPRETKRPSPPPDAEKKVSAPGVASTGGFMAYASSSSPFATIRGQNVFSKASSSSAKATSPVLTPAKSPFADTSSVIPSTTPAKRTGFEAFASSSLPFASVAKAGSPVLGAGSKLGRSKSPPRKMTPGSLNAFSAYTGEGAHGFALPVAKRSRADSPEDGSKKGALDKDNSDGDTEDEPKKTFGERLRATREDEQVEEEYQPKINLKEQEVTTGEEDEETISQVRGKLYTLDDGTAWKERGTGVLKLNVRASDGGSPRLVMRKDAVYTLLLNVTLFRGMRVELAQDPRYLRFSAIENGATVHYNLRLPNAKIATEFMEEVHANIPTTSEPV